jgi:hypothetical protein
MLSFWLPVALKALLAEIKAKLSAYLQKEETSGPWWLPATAALWPSSSRRRTITTLRRSSCSDRQDFVLF